MMKEEWTEAKLVSMCVAEWSGNVNDWFDFRVPGLLRTSQSPAGPGFESGSHLLTYELPFGMVGWPAIYVAGATGGVMEVICQESWDPQQKLLGTQFFSWSRFHLSNEQTIYECFDYECCRYRYAASDSNDCAPEYAFPGSWARVFERPDRNGRGKI